ncbi:MAG: two component transcriptional regulator, winged helix family [Desertimonas sp.]|nr:two component transcriptional regulator, winged helix family [Desertimonas sp.]
MWYYRYELERGTGSGSPVLVVEDDDSCRALIVTLLLRIGCTVYEAASGDDALDVARTVRPALVILDVDLPRVTGYEVCRELRDTFGDAISIMFVSGTRAEALDRVAGFLIGADDYVVKPFDPDELINRARALLRRQPGGGRRPVPYRDAHTTSVLTTREREVLVLLARGRSQGQIAEELVISEKTVATHIQRILAKLGVHSRAQAVAVAYRERLVCDTDSHAIPTAVA